MTNDASTEKPGGAEDHDGAILCQGPFVRASATSLTSPSLFLDASNSAAIAGARMASPLARSGQRHRGLQRQQRYCDVAAIFLVHRIRGAG
jgi:hypothetical protein